MGSLISKCWLRQDEGFYLEADLVWRYSKKRKSHRLVWVARNLKDHIAQPLCHGRLSLDQVAKIPIQLELEYFQWWGNTTSPDCLTTVTVKKFFLVLFTFFQFKVIPPCPTLSSPFKSPPSSFFSCQNSVIRSLEHTPPGWTTGSSFNLSSWEICSAFWPFSLTMTLVIFWPWLSLRHSPTGPYVVLGTSGLDAI